MPVLHGGTQGAHAVGEELVAEADEERAQARLAFLPLEAASCAQALVHQAQDGLDDVRGVLVGEDVRGRGLGRPPGGVAVVAS